MNERPREGNPVDEPTDPELARLYRELAREEPPAHLDAAVRAAARREAGTRPRGLAQEAGDVASSAAAPSRSASRAADLGAPPQALAAPVQRGWRLPVSIAAVVVLSVSVVTLMMEKDGEPLVAPLQSDSQPMAGRTQDEASDSAGRLQPFVAAPPLTASGKDRQVEPAPLPRREGGTPPSAAMRAPQARLNTPPAREEARERRDAAVSETAKGEEEVQRSGDSRPSEPATARVKEKGTPEATRALRSRPAPQAAAPLTGSTPPAGSAPSVLVSEYENQPPEKWGEKIVELRRQGRSVEADELLAEFKRRFPGYSVPVEWLP